MAASLTDNNSTVNIIAELLGTIIITTKNITWALTTERMAFIRPGSSTNSPNPVRLKSIV